MRGLEDEVIVSSSNNDRETTAQPIPRWRPIHERSNGS